MVEKNLLQKPVWIENSGFLQQCDSGTSGPRYQPSDQTNWIKGEINISNETAEPFWSDV